MDIANIIKFAWPDAVFSIGEDYDSLDWMSNDIEKPSLMDIQSHEPSYKQQAQISLCYKALDKLLDEVSQSKSYKNQYTITSYVNSTNTQWKAESEAFIEWRDNLFIYAFQVMDDVLNGNAQLHSVEEFLQDVPVINWP